MPTADAEARVDPRAAKGASHPDLSDAALRFGLALGVRRRPAPKSCHGYTRAPAVAATDHAAVAVGLASSRRPIPLEPAHALHRPGVPVSIFGQLFGACRRRTPRAGSNRRLSGRCACRLPPDRCGPSAFAVGMRRDIEKGSGGLRTSSTGSSRLPSTASSNRTGSTHGHRPQRGRCPRSPGPSVAILPV